MAEVKNMSKVRVFFMLFALFASTMCTMGSMVITPIADQIYAAFASESESLISLGVSGPALIGLPFCFVAGWLCDHIDKKIVMVGGFALFTITSIGGVAVDNVYYFVVTRVCAVGIGWAFTNTAALSILADLYQQEDEHGKIVGWYNTGMSLMGALLSTLGGFLALGGWKDAFNAYWIAIPVLIMLIVFLPKCEPIKNEATDNQIGNSEIAVSSGWWKRLIPLNIQIFLVAICYFQILYMLSLFISDAGIGNAALTGTLASTATIATAIMSLFFGYLYKKMRNAVYLPGLFVMGICMIVMAVAPSVAMCYVCIALMGLAWPTYFCYFYTRCTELVPASKAGIATGVVALSDGLAAALSSYLLLALMHSTGMNAVGVWPIFGITLICVGLVSTFAYFATRKKNAKAKANEESDPKPADQSV